MPKLAVASGQQSKRLKSAINNCAEAFICAITQARLRATQRARKPGEGLCAFMIHAHTPRGWAWAFAAAPSAHWSRRALATPQELPLDPVTAEDGHVYERAAIREWLAKNPHSPLTNQPLGPRLLPAVGVRNAIKALIDSGVVTGELADSWVERSEEKADVARLTRSVNPTRGLALLALEGCAGVGVGNPTRPRVPPCGASRMHYTREQRSSGGGGGVRGSSWGG